MGLGHLLGGARLPNGHSLFATLAVDAAANRLGPWAAEPPTPDVPPPKSDVVPNFAALSRPSTVSTKST